MAAKTFVLDFSDFEMPNITPTKGFFKGFKQQQTVLESLKFYLDKKAKILSAYINPRYPLRYTPSYSYTTGGNHNRYGPPIETHTVYENWYLNFRILIKICSTIIFKHTDLSYLATQLIDEHLKNQPYMCREFSEEINKREYLTLYSSSHLNYTTPKLEASYFVKQLIYYINQRTGKSLLDKQVYLEAKQRNIGKDQKILEYEQQEEEKRKAERQRKDNALKAEHKQREDERKAEQERQFGPMKFQRKCDIYIEKKDKYIEEYKAAIAKYNEDSKELKRRRAEIIKMKETNTQLVQRYIDRYNRVCVQGKEPTHENVDENSEINKQIEEELRSRYYGRYYGGNKTRRCYRRHSRQRKTLHRRRTSRRRK